MSWGYKISVAVLLAILFAGNAFAGGEDRWFAKDKFKHFAVSAFYSAGTAQVARRHFDLGKGDARMVGIGITISLGAAKEAIDSRSPNENASVRDLVWDLAGTLLGSLAFSITR